MEYCLPSTEVNNVREKQEITFKLNSLAGLMCLLLCATGFCGVCISHCTIEVQRYLVPPFFGPGRTKVVLLVVLGGAVRGSVLGFGVVVAEQYWVIVCNHLNIKVFLLVANFLWISKHVRVEWRCDVFDQRDIWDIFLDLGYFLDLGIILENFFGFPNMCG